MKNEYVCVEIEKADDFIERIEELESRGFVTMSAGHADKGVWYAILRRDAHAQQTPKDEAAELLEAAREIAKHCARIKGCYECRFASRINGLCLVRGIPADWKIIKEDGNV